LKRKKTLSESLIEEFHKPMIKRFWERIRRKFPRTKRHKKVHETKMRSFLKTMGFRIVEVLIDTLLLQTINPSIQENILMSIGIELVCWLLGFIWERLWNLTDFGREIAHKCPKCEQPLECPSCKEK
jgi:hypothetical protein